MINNVTLKEIGEILLNAERVVLFPHENPDGDALGSCIALCAALRKAKAEATILLDAKMPEYIDFLGDEYCTIRGGSMEQPDVCVCIDCSEDARIQNRVEEFYSGKHLICIDHHATAVSYGDSYYIDPEQAAVAQIIYRLIGEMGIALDREMANAIYTAISTDTGNFRYSNTTAETHEIVKELFDLGIDHNDIMVRLYQSIDFRQMLIQCEAMKTMDIFAGGRGTIAYVTREMLEGCHAKSEHTEQIIDSLRDIRGVEIAAFLRERGNGRIKVSLRAKTYGDVGQIAGEFGGGGHVRSAGCTLNMDMASALGAVKRAIEESLGV